MLTSDSAFSTRVRRLTVGLVLLETMLVAPRVTIAQADRCDTAVDVSTGTYSGTTSDASSDGRANCGRSVASRDRFYRFTAENDGRLRVHTCGSGFDTVLSLHSGCPAGPASELACNDDSCSEQSELSWSLVAGESTWIRVSGYNGAAGSYELSVEFFEGGAKPDAAVVDIREIEQVGRRGAEVGLSMRSIICNLGAAPMDWHANPDPRHPFLVFNLYRLKDDRLEQIGQSWVKHGYRASQDGGCGAICTPTPTSNFLGAGCADEYGVGTNGRQSGFGPRVEIEPWTGAFTFEGSHMDTTDLDDHNAVEHRLRVHDRDLDPARNAGARYFSELYVIAHDDPRHDNNVGYKELTVAGRPGGTWDLHFLPGSANEGTVLWEWFGALFTILPENDEALDDGIAYLKTKVTENPDGTWHYEYAISNLDMTRAIAAFHVPVGPDVELTNVEFYAPSSHDEGFSNEAWAVERDARGLVWRTPTHDSGESSNPLRWGTLYNFRFDADVPPIESRVAIEPFLSGGPDRLEGTAPAPSNPLPPAPEFKRADTDQNGVVELGDAVTTAGYLFLGVRAPACLDAADADDSGEIDVSDVIAPLSWLFSGAAPPPAPGPLVCGPDSTPADPPLPLCVYDASGC